MDELFIQSMDFRLLWILSAPDQGAILKMPRNRTKQVRKIEHMGWFLNQKIYTCNVPPAFERIDWELAWSLQQAHVLISDLLSIEGF